jgi:hypothetical protein
MIPKKTLFVAVLFTVGLVSLTTTATVSAAPNFCTLYSSSTNTSSDSSMQVWAYAYSCPGGSSGQSKYEAYSGGSYTNSFSGTVCGQSFSTGTLDDFVVTQAPYSNVCYYYYNTSDYNTGTQYTVNLGSGSGATTVSIEAWSGNCNTFGSGSPCTTSTSASAP